ncbi:hypothetical protein JTE90_020734 [Oedothorax gibbosus]|uniref:Uncharacterized protein n=1 Tax=Oedothorax gibbosus TaxID=931172 RepID=A0AAV6V3Z8_9ARAC|nr:hypothetical protein JTE90_020734 [Oedothorax gibbosus]
MILDEAILSLSVRVWLFRCYDCFQVMAYLLRGASFQLVSLGVLSLVFDIDVALDVSPDIQRNRQTPILLLVWVPDYPRRFCLACYVQKLDRARDVTEVLKLLVISPDKGLSPTVVGVSSTTFQQFQQDCKEWSRRCV